MTDGDCRSIAALSAGVTEDDHNIGSSSYCDLIPCVRSAGYAGESRENGTTASIVVESLEKMSEIAV